MFLSVNTAAAMAATSAAAAVRAARRTFEDSARTPSTALSCLADSLADSLAAVLKSAPTLPHEEWLCGELGWEVCVLLASVCELVTADSRRPADQQHKLCAAATRVLAVTMRALEALLPELRQMEILDLLSANVLSTYPRYLSSILQIVEPVAAGACAAPGAFVLLTLAAKLKEVFVARVVASPAHLDMCCRAVLHGLPGLEPEQQAHAWQMLIALLHEVGQSHQEGRAGAVELLGMCEALFHRLIAALLAYEDCLDDAGFAAARDALRTLIQRAEVQWQRGRQQRRVGGGGGGRSAAAVGASG